MMNTEGEEYECSCARGVVVYLLTTRKRIYTSKRRSGFKLEAYEGPEPDVYLDCVSSTLSLAEQAGQ
jgi:hypothetical protein